MTHTVFQKFDLDLDEMMELDEEQLKELNLPEAGRVLIKELLGRGYIVLCSNKLFSSVPENIIIGGDYGMDHKGDFGEITERLGLRFSSGNFYTIANSYKNL